MKRITVRLHQQQYEILTSLAQELSTDVTGAVRSLISGHQRTQRLLDAIEEIKQEILKAVATSREAATENLKRAVLHLSNLLKKEPV